MDLRALSRLPLLIAAVIVAFLFAGWVLYALDVSEASWVVAAVMDVARLFAEPFRFIVQLDNNVLQIAINWGIGAIAYLVAGVLLGRGLAMLGGLGGRGRAQRAA